MTSGVIEQDSYDTQKFLALQESLLRIPLTREGGGVSASQRKHATDATNPAADHLQTVEHPQNSGESVALSITSSIRVQGPIETCLSAIVATQAASTTSPELLAPPDGDKRLQSTRSHHRPNSPTNDRDMMRNSGSDGRHTQSSGLNDTQLLPSQVYANYERSLIEKATFAATVDSVDPHTLQDGESGHVRLVDDGPDSVGELLALDDDEDDSADELGNPTQARTEAITSPTSFSPVTPAIAGKKRDARGHIVTPATRTPTADLTRMFKDQPKTSVGLSQLFQQTQATSSPLLDAFRSDPVFERPSPDLNLRLQTSPAVRPSSSRTTRDLTEPKDNYISVKESQELRKRKRRVRSDLRIQSSPGPLSDVDSDDLLEDTRTKRLQVIDKDLKSYVAPVKYESGRRRRRSFGTSATVIGLVTQNHRGEDLVSDDKEFDNDADEVSDAGSDDQYDELSQAIIMSERSISPRALRDQGLIFSNHVSDNDFDKGPDAGVNSARQPDIGLPRHESPTVNVADSQPNPQKDWDDSGLPRPALPSSDQNIPRVSSSQGPSLSSNTRTLLAATPLSKSIVQPSSMRPPPPGTSQLHPVRSESPTKSQEVQSSPPVLPRSQDKDKTQDEYDAANSDVEEEDEIQPRNTMSRLSYTVPDTSPSSSTQRVKAGGQALARRNHVQSERLAHRHEGFAHHQAYETSETTTPFETARTTLSGSKEGANESTSRQDDQEAAKQSFHKMSEILADPSPADANQSAPIDINIFNESDEEFHETINRPEREVKHRTRRQRLNERALREPAQQLNTAPTAPSENPTKANVSYIAEYPAEKPDMSTDSPRAKRSSARRRAMMDSKFGDSIAETPQPSKQNPIQEPVRVTENDRNDPETNGSGDELRGDPTNPEIDEYTVARFSETSAPTNPFVTRRVLARFRGSSKLYPATCLGLSDASGSSLKVCFDDGTADDVAPVHVRRLELRVGDQIKVDLPEYRTNVYIIHGLEQSGSHRISGDDQYPKTDVAGNDSAVLVEKPRGSLPIPEAPQTFNVPITSLYVTGTMWPRYRDREYMHVPNPNEQPARVLTPLDSTQVKTSPSTRHKRHASKPGIKFENLCLLANGLFSNMAFALSYDDDDLKEPVSKTIIQHGGLILEEGFHQLFSLSGSSSKDRERSSGKESCSSKGIVLAPNAINLGFTALIASNYSRRAKYLQALALDIPCLSHQWIFDSTQKGQLMPWKRYLLPAGNSTYLHNVVRSRTMTEYVDPSLARFQTIFENKPRLLDGQRILFIPGKRYDTKRTALPDLILMMGAEKVRRATSISMAKSILDQESGDWDCVFVEEQDLDQAQRELTRPAVLKKPKRKPRDEPMSRNNGSNEIKIVSDEFVIQSLILGELLES